MSDLMGRERGKTAANSTAWGEIVISRSCGGQISNLSNAFESVQSSVLIIGGNIGVIFRYICNNLLMRN
ncbi:hypothetical protein [Pandoraea sp. NPDC087047]|uniref:hypothetical protein n=1 Tax=Pandoraea sp. NPDC087047 TaxID=3364390 RepID=UPI0038078B13